MHRSRTDLGIRRFSATVEVGSVRFPFHRQIPLCDIGIATVCSPVGHEEVSFVPVRPPDHYSRGRSPTACDRRALDAVENPE